jgi:hypothetical protein
MAATQSLHLENIRFTLLRDAASASRRLMMNLSRFGVDRVVRREVDLFFGPALTAG